MNNKAQGLPISTVILAALGLVVLLVLFGVLTGKLQIFGRGLSTCPGECMDPTVCTDNDGYNLGSEYKAPEECKRSDYICCSVRKPKEPTTTAETPKKESPWWWPF